METTVSETVGMVPVENGATEAAPPESSDIEAVVTDSGPTGPDPVESELHEVAPDGEPIPGEPAAPKQLRSWARGERQLLRLENCGHKFDPTNEPQHRNCHECWYVWFETHPQLVEVADQFYRAHGRRAVAGMRSEKFVKFFEKYMATKIEQQKEKDALQIQQPTGEDVREIDGLAEVVAETAQSSPALVCEV